MLERAYTLCEDDQIQPHDLRLADAPGASQEGAASLSEKTTSRTTWKTSSAS